ncbi:MMPL family transporter [candidate division KSB1 bacterium]|nr:MMPL family transporter [candidate division KSB1 bacterium]RQW10426.1 MAG: multidrug RND transporter [candidate division KSB1 bacterium]
MREKILRRLADLHAQHPWRMLIFVSLLTILFMIFAGQLTTTMRVSDLMPEKHPRVVAFNKVIDEFAAATNLTVVVQGDEHRIKAFADALAPRILSLVDSSQNEKWRQEIAALDKKLARLDAHDTEKQADIVQEIRQKQRRLDFKLFQRVDYKTDTEFFKDHMLMLIKAGDLNNTKELFMDPNLVGLIRNLNNSMEKEYVGQQQSISTREKEDGAVAFIGGIENLIETLQLSMDDHVTPNAAQKAADKLLFGEPYMLSYDRSALVMIGIPHFTIMDRDLLLIAAVQVQELVDDMLQEFPDVSAGLTGSIAREHDEQVYAEQSFSYSTIIAFVFILFILVFSFRMWVAPLFAMATLFIGVIWAMGAAWLAVQQLNMMTAMMAVILLGLGIDFAIHFVASFTERRAAGDTIDASLEHTFLKSVKGIITGALTTACAFLTLMISETRGMRELGIVIGVGLLAILLATVLVLPIMLVLRERRIDKKIALCKKTRKKRDISFRFLGRLAEHFSGSYAFTLGFALVITAILIWSALQIKYDHNMMNIEPKGLQSIALQDTVLEKFDLSLESSLILANSVQESRELAEKSKDKSSVALVSDISAYLPTPREQAERAPHIMEIKTAMHRATVRQDIAPTRLPLLIDELDRLETNIIEMQDMAFLGGQDKVDNACKTIVGDPENPDAVSRVQQLIAEIENASNAAPLLSQFQRFFAPYFKNTVLRMSTTDPITLSDLPVSVLDQYSNKTREKFLVTVYPAGPLWEDKEFLERFNADLDRVSQRATGSAPLFTALISIFARDGRNAVLLTVMLVFALLWIDFRKPQYALLAMIPLAAGIFWMVGLMNLVGMQFNFVNLIGLPLIIGIGIDDGVHLMHRWKIEGHGHMRTVFAGTGKAILLTSLTTMFAFGSLIFSAFRGWASFGAALTIGVGACFLTSIIFLPGVMGFLERKVVHQPEKVREVEEIEA